METFTCVDATSTQKKTCSWEICWKLLENGKILEKWGKFDSQEKSEPWTVVIYDIISSKRWRGLNIAILGLRPIWASTRKGKSEAWRWCPVWAGLNKVVWSVPLGLQVSVISVTVPVGHWSQLADTHLASLKWRLSDGSRAALRHSRTVLKNTAQTWKLCDTAPLKI